MYAATVVITTYNQARWIRGAVRCVLEQSVPCEIVIVDDGSEDNTAAIVGRFEDRVEFISLPHSGSPSAGRNAGARAASTPYVSFLDADDYLEPTKVEKQINELESADRDWCLCDALVEGWEVGGKTAVATGRAGDLVAWLSDSNKIPTAVPLLRVDLARSVAFREDVTDFETLAEDWDYWKRVASIAPAAYVPEVLATYRWVQHGRSGRVGVNGRTMKRRRRRPGMAAR